MEDVLFHNRAVQVVGSVAQPDLCELHAHANPVGRHMVEVVEEQASHRERPELFGSRWGVAHRDPIVFRLIGQGNEAGEPTGLILQPA